MDLDFFLISFFFFWYSTSTIKSCFKKFACNYENVLFKHIGYLVKIQCCQKILQYDYSFFSFTKPISQRLTSSTCSSIQNKCLSLRYKPLEAWIWWQRANCEQYCYNQLQQPVMDLIFRTVQQHSFGIKICSFYFTFQSQT